MEDARALAGLRETVKLIGDERLLEGWAARGGQVGPAVLGLILVTDERLVFVDTAGGMMAFPILKISTAEVTSACDITFTAWFGRMMLTFDTAGTLRSMLNLARQDPAWCAVEINFARRSGRNAGVTMVEGFEALDFAAAAALPRARAVTSEPLEVA